MVADVVTGKVDVREAAAKLPKKADEVEALDETAELIDDADDMVDDLDVVPEAANA